jgi:hypothetical protein
LKLALSCVMVHRDVAELPTSVAMEPEPAYSKLVKVT